jgi:MYXO-CTERM domain-containing protein
VRKTTRVLVAGTIGAAAVLMLASPAAAKCGHGTGFPCPDPVRLEVTVYDPTWESIIIRGEDVWTMLNVTGVNYRPFNVRDYPPERLGSQYQAIYRFTQGDRSWVLYQRIYPYAEGRPFAFTPAGQQSWDRFGEVDESTGAVSFPTMEAAHGWRGSRTLGAILQEHGLPSAPGAGTITSTSGVVSAAGRGDGGGPPSWTWLAGGVGLLGLGGLAARQHLRRRALRAVTRTNQ